MDTKEDIETKILEKKEQKLKIRVEGIKKY